MMIFVTVAKKQTFDELATLEFERKVGVLNRLTDDPFNVYGTTSWCTERTRSIFIESELRNVMQNEQVLVFLFIYHNTCRIIMYAKNPFKLQA